MKRIAIIGAGITGLSAAWHLKRAGATITLYEASSRVGGSVRTERCDGWLVDAGPNTLLLRDTSHDAMLRELGLDTKTCLANPLAKQRYILQKDRLVPLPTSFWSALTTPLLGPIAKLRLLCEPFVEKNHSEPDEMLSSFIRRRCGQKFLERIVNPFVGGIYACEPGDLATRHAFPRLWQMEQAHGSLFSGMRAARKAGGKTTHRLISFSSGLGCLTEALANSLDGSVRLGKSLCSLSRDANGACWKLGFDDGESTSEAFDAVLLTLPPSALASLQIEERQPLKLLGTLQSSSVAVLSLGYLRDQVAHPLDGFGMLVPQCENRRILGTLFSSTLFPDRAPHGHVLLTTFVGGRQAHLLSLNDEALFDLVRQELSQLVGASGSPVFQRIDRWQNAIPRYGSVFQSHLDVVSKCETNNAGIFIAGTARNGVSLPDCLSAGENISRKIILTT